MHNRPLSNTSLQWKIMGITLPLAPYISLGSTSYDSKTVNPVVPYMYSLKNIHIMEPLKFNLYILASTVNTGLCPSERITIHLKILYKGFV